MSPSSRFHVAIIDPHIVLRFGVRHLLSKHHLDVCWETPNSSSARNLLDQRCPDLVIYEPAFEAGHSMEFLGFLRTRHPCLKVVVMTMAIGNVDVGRFLKQGVLALVSKTGELNELLHAVDSAKTGQVYVSSQILNGMRAGPDGSFVNVELLSAREREVFRLIGLGLKASEIASSLGISPRTVDAHKQHIKDKLSLNGSIDLTAAAGKCHHRDWVQPGGGGV